MNRYSELGEQLDEVLQMKKAVSIPGSLYGMTPAEGKEAEWDMLNKKAENIRAEMRRVRYGSE